MPLLSNNVRQKKTNKQTNKQKQNPPKQQKQIESNSLCVTISSFS